MHNHTFKLKRINLERIQKWVIKDKEGVFKKFIYCRTVLWTHKTPAALGTELGIAYIHIKIQS